MSVLCCGKVCGGRWRVQCSAVVFHTIHQKEAALLQISATAGGKAQTICASHLSSPISPVTWDFADEVYA